MGWASSVVSPPEGDMSAYCSNLRSLLQRDDIVYLPGHGPPLPEPQVHVVALLRHREQRERQIQDLLKSAPSRIDEIVDALYKKEHPRLYRAAKRNAFAHLLKLQDEGSVRQRRDNRWEPLFRV